MKCEQVRERLRQGFDEGLDPRRGVESHLATCDACQRYAEELFSLGEALASLPLEDSAPELVLRIRAAVSGEASQLTRARIYAVVSVLTLAVAVVVGWLYPLTLHFDRQWLTADWWLVSVPWLEPGPPIQDQLAMLWAPIARRVDAVPALSSGLLWVCLGVVTAMLIIFNGLEAWSLRPVQDGAHVRHGPERRE